MKIYFVMLSLLTVFTCYAQEKIVLIADPAVLAIPIHENHDPLVDLVNQNEISFGPSPIIANDTNYTKMRKTVYKKLLQAQSLLPEGLKFCLYEGYRSLDLQQFIFDRRYSILRSANPTKSHEQIFIESTKFVSPVINLDGSQNIPPHSTGAAIDVYLVDHNGKPIDMGILLDETDKDLDGSLCKTNSSIISKQAMEYRKIMSDALTSVGFINYPTEYWHWSYGERYWAHQTNQPYAIYGSISSKGS